MTFRAFLFCLALSPPVLAYLDPVTGNILIQAVLAGFAALALFYHRVKTYFSSLFGKKEGKKDTNKPDGGEPDKESDSQPDKESDSQPDKESDSQPDKESDSQPDNDKAAVK